MSKDLRQQMPETAAFLDEMRKVFGKESIDVQVRKALKGQPTFWARENSHMLGVRDTSADHALKWDEKGISYWATPEWVHDARHLAQRLGVDIKPADPADLNDAVREADELRALIEEAKRRRDSAHVCNAEEGKA